MGIDLSTKAGVLRFCELRRAEMVGCFERLGRFEMNGYSFGGYVFATHDVNSDGWKTGAKLDRVNAELCRMPKALIDQIPPGRQTEVFAHVMREFTKLTRAIGTVVMTEMWHVTMPGKPGKSAEEVRDELPDSLEHAPGRCEALYLQLEHGATGRRVWVAEIKRNPTRIEPWYEPYGPGETDMKGRLVDLAAWKS
jgi:hypothetical protein